MGHDKDVYTDSCVCDILLDIVEKQDKVSPASCASGCRTALHELCGQVQGAMYTTIPVSLICRSTCDYFIGMGVRRAPDTPTTRVAWESVVFRVIDVDPETCCATLELLQAYSVTNPVPDGQTKAQYLFSQITSDADYIHTGICITVDLDCFCGVECHPPVTPGQL